MTLAKKFASFSPMTHSPPPIQHPKKRTIGLLGGSFNPAHAGHVHISIEAKKRLKLAEVWWLVSPQNPLKPLLGMAPFEARFAGAQTLTAKHPFIHISDIEKRLNTRYTIDTLRKLKRRFPRVQFVWLMGADNLATIHRWEEWAEIFEQMPVLVLDRAPFSHSALRKKAALRFAGARKKTSEISALAALRLPAWGFVHMRKHPESATNIRKQLENAKK